VTCRDENLYVQAFCLSDSNAVNSLVYLSTPILRARTYPFARTQPRRAHASTIGATQHAHDAGRQTDRQADSSITRHTDTQTYTQTDRRTDRQTDESNTDLRQSCRVRHPHIEDTHSGKRHTHSPSLPPSPLHRPINEDIHQSNDCWQVAEIHRWPILCSWCVSCHARTRLPTSTQNSNSSMTLMPGTCLNTREKTGFCSPTCAQRPSSCSSVSSPPGCMSPAANRCHSSASLKSLVCATRADQGEHSAIFAHTSSSVAA